MFVLLYVGFGYYYFRFCTNVSKVDWYVCVELLNNINLVWIWFVLLNDEYKNIYLKL